VKQHPLSARQHNCAHRNSALALSRRPKSWPAGHHFASSTLPNMHFVGAPAFPKPRISWARNRLSNNSSDCPGPL